MGSQFLLAVSSATHRPVANKTLCPRRVPQPQNTAGPFPKVQSTGEIGWSRFNGCSSSATLLTAANFLLSSAVVSVSGLLWLTPLSHHGRLCVRAYAYGITRIREDTAAKKCLSINVISTLHCRRNDRQAGLSAYLPTLLIERRRCAPALTSSQLLLTCVGVERVRGSEYTLICRLALPSSSSSQRLSGSGVVG